MTNELETPKGKRSVRRRNDNLVGYIGGKPWEIINGRGIDIWGETAEKASRFWIEGRTDWYEAAWLE